MTLERCTFDEVAYQGKRIRVQAIEVGKFTIAVLGKFLRIATIKDEKWLDDYVKDPGPIIAAIREIKPSVDIFSFSQRLPNAQPEFSFYCEYSNLAAIPVSTYDNWFKKQIKAETRNMIRKAKKKGVTTRLISLDDALVDGIVAIYNETPVRQGKKFWHYGKDRETVGKENATFLDRADFAGAFLGDEMIGFLKLVSVGQYAQVMQIISFMRHRDKAPMNALVAKAVEICAARGLSHLVYGEIGNDSLSDFKRHNGFQQIDIPKYYVPLTTKGAAAVRLGLHNPKELVPQWITAAMRDLRAKWYERNARGK
jgi:hypothetical protein